MGQILSQPVVEKHSDEHKDKYLAYGISCMQGWRINMEDSHATILNLYDLPMKKSLSSNSQHDEDSQDSITKSQQQQQQQQPQQNNDFASSTIEKQNSQDIKDADNDTQMSDSDEKLQENKEETDASPPAHIGFFGVYDGHGGEKAAIFTGEKLHYLIKETKEFKQKDYINALKQGFLSCDQEILKDFYMRDDDSGCAATSAIITPDLIVCGNAGDSRTIMSTNGFAKALSFDHKPSNEGEKARICAAGGYVDMGRVNGNLALSRGIGDFDFKKNVDLPAEEQIVTCYPDVIQHNIDYNSDEFVVLACDGIWDCLTSQKCVECVRRGIYEKKSLSTICEEIMDLCCAPTSDGSGIGCDNMSIAIVALLDYTKNETLDQWYEKIISRIEQQKNDPNSLNKYGPISQPYNELYKEMYGEYYDIGQQGQGGNGRSNIGGAAGGASGSGGTNINGNSIFGRSGYDEEEDEEKNVEGRRGDQDESALNGGAISLQKLLASNAITNENGVIYLDTSSAQSLLAHFGVADAGAHEEDDDEEEDEEGEDVHQGLAHEEEEEEESKIEEISEELDDEVKKD
ncbi:protein phosphatase, putative [Candida dubliniensis CD36]|uniref:protein-serine/threonine phosphatase n=1 Tax=Candida dubliniensis (strain CD36 / ATCC MYA-646 / CBS 7987 / NCPF 3949 / NRRL Y-17841) TaxID=573826 RepID=B9WKY2_CANDC|nr:protein phosphatase, putative [Candida dubliniensis CD36]CAX39683.1 protein phosphatase, putative [Candida dubliniensis CD36]